MGEEERGGAGQSAGQSEGQGADGEQEIVPGCNRALHKRRKRQNLFGKERKERFLEHFAATCNVTESAGVAGVAVSTVYSHRMRYAEFRADWDSAVEQGYARLEAEAIESKAAEAVELRGDKEIERTTGLSFDEKMQLLRHHQRGLQGQVQRNRPVPRRVPADEVAARLVKKLIALGVRIGEESGGPEADTADCTGLPTPGPSLGPGRGEEGEGA